MKDVTSAAAPQKFTPMRGLFWVAVILFCLNMLIDVMIFHGIASSTTRQAGHPVNWVATPYTSFRAGSFGKVIKETKLSVANWYPKDLSISKSGLKRSWKAGDQAAERLVNKVIKP